MAIDLQRHLAVQPFAVPVQFLYLHNLVSPLSLFLFAGFLRLRLFFFRRPDLQGIPEKFLHLFSVLQLGQIDIISHAVGQHLRKLFSRLQPVFKGADDILMGMDIGTSFQRPTKAQKQGVARPLCRRRS